MVGGAAAAIHASRDTVQRLHGGLAPGMADPTSIEYGSFLSQALDAGEFQAPTRRVPRGHRGPFSPGDDPTAGYLGRLRIQAQTLRAALAAHGVTKPLVFTQLSYSTGAASSPRRSRERRSSQLRSAAANRRRPAVIVSQLLDNGDGSKVQGFGVLRPDRTPKTAYCRLAAAPRGSRQPPGC